MKNLFILLAFLFVTFSSYAVAPYGIKGQQQSTTLYSNVHQFPNNQVTNLGGINALVETGNKNLLSNPSFEHSTFSTSWTNSAGTFTKETSTVIDGKASAKLVLSSQTMSLTQSSTLYASAFADGVQGLASVRIKSDVAVKVCAIQAGTVSTVDCVDVASDNKWSFYKIPFILGATSNGISIASSGAVSGTVYIDEAFVGAANVTDIAPIITDWVDFPSVAAGTLITATGGGFTSYGTVVNNKAQWRRVGSNMEIRWDYRQSATTGLVAGTGNYLFNLPSGYEMDTSKVIVNSLVGATAGAGNDSSSLGSLRGTYGTSGNIDDQVYAYSSTQLKAYGINSTGSSVATGYWGPSGTLDFAVNAIMSFNLSASVPIKGWGSNSSMYSAPCGANCVDSFSAKIFRDGTITTSSVGGWITSCTAAPRSTCTFKAGLFTVAPTCTVSVDQNASNVSIGSFLTAPTTTSVQTVIESASNTELTTTFDSYYLFCQKQGADFTASRTIVGSFKAVKVIQNKRCELNTTSTGTTVIPFDDTIPQITEGNLFLNCSITPLSSNSRLRIKSNALMGETTNTGNWAISALFRDSTADAIAANVSNLGADSSSIGLSSILTTAEVDSVSTTSTTFSLRGSVDVGTTRINGRSTARLMGGSATSWIEIDELAP